MIFFNYRSDLTQTVAETDFTRQNRDENSLIDENLPSNGTDINAISDGRKRSVIVIKHVTKGFKEKNIINVVSRFDIHKTLIICSEQNVGSRKK